MIEKMCRKEENLRLQERRRDFCTKKRVFRFEIYFS